MPFASGAIVPARPPVATTRGDRRLELGFEAREQTLDETHVAEDDSERRQSAVFLPIAFAGGVNGTRNNRAARLEERLGRDLEPRRERAAEEVTFGAHDVEVRGRPEVDDDRRAAVASVCGHRVAMRSAPTSDGLSTRNRTPVLMPGPMTSAGRIEVRSASRVKAAVSGGTTEPSTSASTSSSERSSRPSSASIITASSSSV